LRRLSLPANALALAWLAVIAIRPTDIATPGCQLSFLAVVILTWGVGRWFRPSQDPLERLIEQSRSYLEKLVRWLGKRILVSYLIMTILWLASAPLVAARYHLVSFVALLIGPPVMALGSLALISGFLLLTTNLIWSPLDVPFAWTTQKCLGACESLVGWAERIPGGHWYVAGMPDWWLWGFYIGLLSSLLIEPLRRYWPKLALAALAWLAVGLAADWRSHVGLRCTFLAVGHGGCTVLETSDGRVLLYDAGALGGPDVTRRQIAPFLWSRGIRRIDEVLLSHADLDHFNGLPSLLERFAVKQVTCTPTFASKSEKGVSVTLEALRGHHVPVRIVQSGDRLIAGDVVMEVMHPPQIGPEGNENARSLVLLIRHEGHTILLTGDLEGPGLQRVLQLTAPKVDVLMAPHHGSRASNNPQLARWAKAKLAVACQGPPRRVAADPYSSLGAIFWGTWPEGAVIIESLAGSLTAETFVSKRKVELR
jgi:competence protein ComEC